MSERNRSEGDPGRDANELMADLPDMTTDDRRQRTVNEAARLFIAAAGVEYGEDPEGQGGQRA